MLSEKLITAECVGLFVTPLVCFIVTAFVVGKCLFCKSSFVRDLAGIGVVFHCRGVSRWHLVPCIDLIINTDVNGPLGTRIIILFATRVTATAAAAGSSSSGGSNGFGQSNGIIGHL